VCVYLKQWIWPRTGVCGGCCRCTVLHNRELHNRNDADDVCVFPCCRALIPVTSIKPLDTNLKTLSLKRTVSFVKATKELARHQELMQHASATLPHETEDNDNLSGADNDLDDEQVGLTALCITRVRDKIKCTSLDSCYSIGAVELFGCGCEFQDKPETKLVIEKRTKGHHKKMNKRRRNDEVQSAIKVSECQLFCRFIENF